MWVWISKGTGSPFEIASWIFIEAYQIKLAACWMVSEGFEKVDFDTKVWSAILKLDSSVQVDYFSYNVVFLSTAFGSWIDLIVSSNSVCSGAAAFFG